MKRIARLGAALILSAGGVQGAPAANPIPDLPPVVIARAATGNARSVQLAAPPGLARGAAADPGAVAWRAVTAHAGQFGLASPATQLREAKRSRDALGHTRIAYEQLHNGVPVFGVLLLAHVDANGHTHRLNGVIVPDLAENTTPALDEASAIRHASKPGDIAPPVAPLAIWRANLSDGREGENHLVYLVRLKTADGDVTRMIDAHTGTQVNEIKHSYDALNRRVYSGTTSSLVWQEGNALPYAGGDSTEINAAIDATGQLYHLLHSLSNGRDSFDGAGTGMTTLLNDPSNANNAQWNGAFTVFGNGLSVDDVVAHEWGHAYTQYTADLIYQWQSGALNEAYSDIWGETVDLLNGTGNDTATVRWRIAEDSSLGAIRNMYTPTLLADPGKVSDAQYSCGVDQNGNIDGDAGGVHTNSGVPNHAYALLVDGGTYNGYTITAIGMTKAAHIHWRALETYLVPSSDFFDHADALEQSCADLMGQPLNALNIANTVTSTSAVTITAADCAAVANAVAAVQFRQVPACTYSKILQSPAPAICPAGQVSSTVAAQTWEGGLGSWITGTRNVGNAALFDSPPWRLNNWLPQSRPGTAMFVENETFFADCGGPTTDKTGVHYLQSPVITLPVGAGALRVTLDHWFASEPAWDGGNVKISVNGGPFNLVPAGNFLHNPYNSSIIVDSAQTNPLQGEAAWTGTDFGSNGGSWGQSQINLGGIANPGDSIRLRFEFGLDACNGRVGWYVDDVSVVSCALPGSPTATPTSTPTATATNTPTRTPTSTSTATNTPTRTPTTTATPTNTPTNTPTATPSNTSTNTPTATATATNTPTAAPTNTPTATPSNTSTNTPTATAINAPTVTGTNTPTATPSNTPTATPTATGTNTPTATPSNTPTATATNAPTATGTNTPTATPSNTPTTTATNTPTASSTNTVTPTPTETATEVPTATSTGTVAPTSTPTPTETPTSNSSPTPTTTPVSQPPRRAIYLPIVIEPGGGP